MSGVRVEGVVLAAGSSMRMGRPKQLLAVGGKPLLRHVVDAAIGSRLSHVVLVLGACAAEVRANLGLEENERLRFVMNASYEQGISTSIRCGIAACDPASDGAAILLADQPDMSAELIDRMLDAFALRRAPVVRPLFRASGAEPVPGHPVVIVRSAWPLLETLTGDEGVRALISTRPELLEDVELEATALEDVDTMDDFRRINDRLGDRAVFSAIKNQGRRGRISGHRDS